MTDKRLLDATGVTLMKAAALIDEQGWWNGKLPDFGTYCPVTAIQEICGRDWGARVNALVQLKNHVGCKHITTWNDNNDKASVVAAMRAAAILP